MGEQGQRPEGGAEVDGCNPAVGRSSPAACDGSVRCRGVRGATTVAADSPDAILEATAELLGEIIRSNGIDPDDVAAAIFTSTSDLTSAFPARAARSLGWEQVALLDAQEIPVPGSLPRCIRVLILWNTGSKPSEIRHVYLREAALLRPDRAAGPAGRQTPEGGDG